VIRAEGLSKTYPDSTRAVRDFDLYVGEGEFVGLLGRSGAGKTTLLRLLNGALRADGGSLEVIGRQLSAPSAPALGRRELRAYRREVGVVYQQHGLVPSLSVLHNVLLGRAGSMDRCRNLLNLLYVPREDVRAISEALGELGLRVPHRRRAGDLSGGQQQRVAVARALWQRPRLLLADEPVASVDTETAEAIMTALRDRNARDGLTVLVSLHQRELALRYCPRVLVLDEGRVTYDGPPDEPSRHAFVASDAFDEDAHSLEESGFVDP